MVAGQYVLHEHLEEVNHPVYFHQFVDHAAAHGLQYLWESYVGELGRSTARSDPCRARAGPGPGRTAAIHRLLDRRRFRSSLLCHEGITLDRNIRRKRMTPSMVVGIAATVLGQPGLRLDGERGVSDPRGGRHGHEQPRVQGGPDLPGRACPAAFTFSDFAPRPATAWPRRRSRNRSSTPRCPHSSRICSVEAPWADSSSCIPAGPIRWSELFARESVYE